MTVTAPSATSHESDGPRVAPDLAGWLIDRARDGMILTAPSLALAHAIHGAVAIYFGWLPLAYACLLACACLVVLPQVAAKARSRLAVHATLGIAVASVGGVIGAAVSCTEQWFGLPIVALIGTTTIGLLSTRLHVLIALMVVDLSFAIGLGAGLGRDPLPWAIAVAGSNLCGVLLSESRRRWLVSSHRRERDLEKTRRRAERESHELAIANEAASAAARAKQEFLAHMSHEIRTPLTGILGLLELIDPAGLSAVTRQRLHQLRRSADLLLATVNDVLDMSKLEASGIEIVEGRVDVADLLGEAAAVVAPLARDRVTVSWSMEPSVPRILRGDPVRLRQMLVNLSNNAVRFTTHGEIELRARLRGEDQIVIEVRDTGPGIADEDRAKIFEPFVQVGGLRSGKSRGTGLGLAIVYGLAQRMGVEIELESTPGVGSIFRLLIPLDQAMAEGSDIRSAPTRGVVVFGIARTGLATRHIESGIRSAACFGMVGTPEDTLEKLREAEGARTGAVHVLVIDAECLPEIEGELARLRPQIEDVVVIARASLVASAESFRTIPFPSSPTEWQRSLRVVRPRSVPPPRLHAPVGVRRRVLVVDDHPTNRTVIEGLLETGGYEVDLAENGQEALRRLSPGHGYFAALLDIGLPDIRGDEVIAEVRKRETAADSVPVPIIAVTAHVLERDRQSILAIGADAFVGKPFRGRELLDALSAFVPGEGRPLLEALVGDAPASAVQLIDEHLVADLLSLETRRPGSVAPILDSFEHTTVEHLVELERVLASGDLDARQRLAHRMAGTAGQVGGAELAAMLRTLERLDPGPEQFRMVTLHETYERTRRALRHAVETHVAERDRL